MIIKNVRCGAVLCERVALLPMDSSEAARYLTACLTKVSRLGGGGGVLLVVGL